MQRARPGFVLPILPAALRKYISVTDGEIPKKGKKATFDFDLAAIKQFAWLFGFRSSYTTLVVIHRYARWNLLPEIHLIASVHQKSTR
jgi:hypothetical protein